MTKSARLSLPLVTRSSLTSLLAACLATLVFSAEVFAGPPSVNIYQSMEAGNNGDVLTAALMTAGGYGAGTWDVYGSNNTMYVSNLNHTDLPGPVAVNGTTYPGTGGTRSWMFYYNIGHNGAQVQLPSSYYNGSTPGITTACYYTPSFDQTWTQIDSIGMEGYGAWCCMQTVVTNAGTQFLRSHSQDPTGASTFGPYVTVQIGKTYWVNTRLDAAGGCSLAVFDPANSFAQVGSVSWCNARPGSRPTEIAWGRYSMYLNFPTTQQGYFDQILVDYTNGLYPLLPNVTDKTPPNAPPAVYDGTTTGVETSTTTSTTQLSANWSAGSDSHSGMFGYRYAIGTTPGGTDVLNWIYLGNVTSFTQPFLSLTVGQTYYFSVKSVNMAGQLSAATVSSGQTVVGGDTPTAPPAVYDGTTTGVETPYTTSTTQLSANWSAASDPQSGITGYQYAIGTTAGGTNVVGWTALGNVLTVTKTGLSLTNGQKYYFSVEAVNGVGTVGPATNSPGQTVDTTPPSAPPAVYDGTTTGVETSTTTSTTQLSANWSASTDSISGISGYQYAIGTTAGGTNVVGWTSAGNVLSVTKTGLSLSVGTTYYFSVKATDNAGLVGSATSSPGQTVLQASGATPVDIYQNMESGNNGDLLTPSIMDASSYPSGSAWTINNSMWVSTANPTNLPGSVSVGGVIYPGTGSTRTWVFNDNNQLNYASCAFPGSYSKITIACYYTPGFNVAWDQCNTIWMQGSAPWAALQIYRDSGGPYLRAQSSLSSTTYGAPINVTPGKTYWVNLHFDGIAGSTSVAVFDPANAFAQVGSTSVANSTLNSTMYGPVEFGRTDNGGNNGATTQSYLEHVLIDYTNGAFPLIPGGGTDTPTAPPAVYDGTTTGVETPYTTSTTQLSANWSAASDPQSGISGYQYAIGTTAGGTNVIGWTSLGNVLTVTKTGLSLTNGQIYYFGVKAVNGVGTVGLVTNSPGQTVDTTPPSALRPSTTEPPPAWKPPTPPRPHSCRRIGAPARTRSAASAATSMPSAPRLAAPTWSAGPRWATCCRSPRPA